MSVLQKTLAVLLLILLGAALYGWWYTNQEDGSVSRLGKPLQQADASVVNQGTFLLAQRLASLADGPDEQRLAASTQRLADHELDLAFTAALRRLEAHPPELTAEARAVQGRLDKSQKLLESDQANVTRLTASLAQANDAQKSRLQDQLDLGSSQLELDKDEVDEANEDLLQAGGNQHQRVQTMMQEHAAAQAHSAPIAGSAAAQPTNGAAGGLVRDMRQWLALHRKQEWLLYAGAQASAYASYLGGEHQKLAGKLQTLKDQMPPLAAHEQAEPATGRAAQAPTGGRAAQAPTGGSTAQAPTGDGRAQAPAGAGATRPSSGAGTVQAPTDSASLARTTRRIAADQQRLTLLDQRIAALEQLSGAYGNWNTLSRAKSLAVLHGMLSGVAVVVGTLLLLLFLDRWLQRLLGRTRLDRRQIETLRSVTRVAIQIVGVLVIFVVIIGVPSQLGTMIGLAGAGLTVALKDFIVAFIGWLVLMGRNGVRLGDWVEINGVSGEVVELGMFHTVLLETGNWTDTSHPTGRRVTFTNSFAVEKHYFNFSTSGQWLWDELLVLVPFEKDPNTVAEAILKEVVSATEKSITEAEQEWGRAAPARRGAALSAAPGVSLKPAVGGVEVSVRYITRASERFQLRARLFQAAVRLLGRAAPQVASRD
ncbi:MAG TPA: mechanosensitive ion channel domain-containing protein [Steroidobacteraceae bacterium]|jgi:small-conductance mechanosensitive channel